MNISQVKSGNTPVNRIRPKCYDRNEHPKRPFSPETVLFRHFFEVKNVLNFPNYSRQ